MMHVGRADESRRFGGGRGKRAGLALPSLYIARDAIEPLAGLRGSDADDQPLAAIPEGGHLVGVEARGAKLNVQLNARVWIGVRGRLLRVQLEQKLAGRVGR